MKTALVTGATDGIGRETARGLLAQGLRVLVNNAGVYEKRRHVTGEGFELTMAVNHFAVFLLTRRLLDRLVAAPAGRIVTVSSMVHQGASIDLDDLAFEGGFDGYRAYAASKLANLLFTRSLARRVAGTRVTANAPHPGVIGTKLLRAAFSMRGASVQQGARTSVYLAASDEVAGVSGRYFVDCRAAAPSREACDEALAEALWQRSEALLSAFL